MSPEPSLQSTSRWGKGTGCYNIQVRRKLIHHLGCPPPSSAQELILPGFPKAHLPPGLWALVKRCILPPWLSRGHAGDTCHPCSAYLATHTCTHNLGVVTECYNCDAHTP